MIADPYRPPPPPSESELTGRIPAFSVNRAQLRPTVAGRPRISPPIWVTLALFLVGCSSLWVLQRYVVALLAIIGQMLFIWGYSLVILTVYLGPILILIAVLCLAGYLGERIGRRCAYRRQAH